MKRVHFHSERTATLKEALEFKAFCKKTQLSFQLILLRVLNLFFCMKLENTWGGGFAVSFVQLGKWDKNNDNCLKKNE